ncbi:MAG: tRNA pseudouridine(38-40) synthase TruA [Candidatus Neomarinimicrobiota bacterium]|nr:tRNA pseudouridine(38-40) synthase TruA [Candidatus Neomarinimicrobiota bacterium]|tara:strand:- start:9563 stop:10297 length:735 start_codon:yes stop_codon:yes gene_type:complete
MSRYKITVQYDGLDFSGFQSQKNLNTIQDKIEHSLSFLNENNLIRLSGASRTDSGVHALGQVAHFDLDTDLSLNAIKRAINARLPIEIRIIDIIEVDDQFHSRFDAIKKEYLYQCCLTDNPLLAKNHFIVKKINFEILKDLETELLGKHDFLSFSKFDIEKKNTICEIFKSKWTLEDDKLFYIIEGNRFLHHMVRYLVGTMIACMEGKIAKKDFLSLLDNPIKNARLFKAPAHGLILNRIFYEN